MSKSSPKQKIESLQGWLLQIARDNKNPKKKIVKRKENLEN